MYAVTGATGHLGQLVVKALRDLQPASRIAALARDPAKAGDLYKVADSVRTFDYDKPETLGPGLRGVTMLLLISSNAMGARVAQHKAVIDAAKAAGVELIAYTGILHGERSPINLGREHTETETLLKQSGLRYVFLRNGWYIENYGLFLRPALGNGVFPASAGDGRISAASRADYAEAAALSLIRDDGSAERVYELAGDTAFTLSQFVAEASRQANRPIQYRNLPEADFAALLIQFGLPPHLAADLAQSSAVTANDALFDDSGALSRLIGHPTAGYGQVIADELRALAGASSGGGSARP
jgi:NAD(P)H dehydrogenase (quinone)